MIQCEDQPFLIPGQTSSPLKTMGTSTLSCVPSSAHTKTKFNTFPSSSLCIYIYILKKKSVIKHKYTISTDNVFATKNIEAIEQLQNIQCKFGTNFINQSHFHKLNSMKPITINTIKNHLLWSEEPFHFQVWWKNPRRRGSEAGT